MAPKRYGVYIRSSDLQAWRLIGVTSLEDTLHEEEFNAQFQLQTLIVGPLRRFPEFLET
jgi:hypothetical protein